MSQADRDSRLTVTTRTAGTEYYDQVLAMSSHVINDGWAKLYKTYTELQSISYEDDDVGKLNGELNPCRISFDGDNRAGIRVFYTISFKSGTLQSPSGSLNCKLKDWILTVSVGVAQQSESTFTEEQKKYMKENFNVPGDYTTARLFADLTDADWNKIQEDRSQFGKDANGNPISWEDWKTANPKLKTKLIAFLDGWVDDMKTKGYSTLGVKVTIPSYEEQNPLDPTYPPTALLHQGFKYTNSSTPANIARDYDCILYCEQLMSRAIPKATFISDGGNWCYPEGSGNPAVHGTFAISGQIFFERKNGLLQHMRPFPRLSEITLDKVVIDNGMYHHYDVGHNPNYESADNDYFLPVKDEAGHRYFWTKTHFEDGSKTWDDGEYGYCQQQSVQSVEISWAPGGSKITLSGRTTYSYKSQWWKNTDKRDLNADLEEAYTANWSVGIVMATDKDGRLTLKLDQNPNDVVVSIKQDSHVEINIGSKQDTPEGYQRTIQSSLRSTLVIVEQNLASIFQTTGQWVYPGNGTLTFENPVFNNHGDVLSEVEYKEVEQVNVPRRSSGSVLKGYPLSTANKFSFGNNKSDA